MNIWSNLQTTCNGDLSKGLLFAVFYVVLGIHLDWNKINSLAHMWVCFQKDSWLCCTGCAPTPYHFFFDLVTVTIFPYFKAIYCVGFSSLTACVIYSIPHFFALQTIITLFYFHRLAILFLYSLLALSFDLQCVKWFFTNMFLIVITERFITLLLWLQDHTIKKKTFPLIFSRFSV